MKPWVDELMTLVEDCEIRESRMTEWEADFVESIRSRLEKERPLTERQQDTLERLWDRVTAHG